MFKFLKLENGVCESPYKSLKNLHTCSSNSDCPIVNQEGQLQGHSECVCGFNSSSFSYCSSVQGDPEFTHYYRAFMYLTIDNYKCHTLARFGECDELMSEIYRNYKTNELKYKFGPIYKMNDLCVAKIINWEFFQHFLKNIKILQIVIFWVYFLIIYDI